MENLRHINKSLKSLIKSRDYEGVSSFINKNVDRKDLSELKTTLIITKGVEGLIEVRQSVLLSYLELKSKL